MLVFFHHSEHKFKAPWLSPLASFGHDAVVFFFLLSGFVIAHNTLQGDKGLRHYAVARLARIYSVVLPALLLIVALQVASRLLSLPSDDGGRELSEWISVLLISLAFLNQSAVVYAPLPTNPAYWSVCYEVWYYVLFACLFYFRGAQRLVLILLVGSVAGLAILVMFPIWLMGFWFYRFHRRIQISPIAGALMFFVPLGVYLAWRGFNIDDKIFDSYAGWLGGAEFLNSKLSFSKRFLVDYITAVLLLFMIAGAFKLAEEFSGLLSRNSKLIGSLASGSFSLYILHMPLLAFVPMIVQSTIVVMSIVLALIYLIAHFTEKKKAPYVKLFQRMMGAVQVR